MFISRAFITQYSRSLHWEYINAGIDILVVMPMYVVSNKYRKTEGTIFAPMPIKVVEGTFLHLGKKFVFQVHGYWFHTLIGSVSPFNPFSARNALNRMEVKQYKYVWCMYAIYSIKTVRNLNLHLDVYVYI